MLVEPKKGEKKLAGRFLKAITGKFELGLFILQTGLDYIIVIFEMLACLGINQSFAFLILCGSLIDLELQSKYLQAMENQLVLTRSLSLSLIYFLFFHLLNSEYILLSNTSNYYFAAPVCHCAMMNKVIIFCYCYSVKAYLEFEFCTSRLEPFCLFVFSNLACIGYKSCCYLIS